MAYRYLIECDSKKQATTLEKTLAEFTAGTSNSLGGLYRHAEAAKNPIIYQKNYPALTMAGAGTHIELLTGEKIAEDFFAGEWKLKEEPQEAYSAEYKFYLIDAGELDPLSMTTQDALVFLRIIKESPLNISHFEKFRRGLQEILREKATHLTFRDEQQHYHQTMNKLIDQMKRNREQTNHADSEKISEPVLSELNEYPLVKLFCPTGSVCLCSTQGSIDNILGFYFSLKDRLNGSWLLRKKWKVDDSRKESLGLRFY
ncbi:MAG: hypothetical protein AABW48_00275 [Nanoarchaeota archaeon]